MTGLSATNAHRPVTSEVDRRLHCTGCDWRSTLGYSKVSGSPRAQFRRHLYELVPKLRDDR